MQLKLILNDFQCMGLCGMLEDFPQMAQRSKYGLKYWPLKHYTTAKES